MLSSYWHKILFLEFTRNLMVGISATSLSVVIIRPHFVAVNVAWGDLTKWELSRAISLK